MNLCTICAPSTQKTAKNDFKTKYAGSYLGVIWAFVQPIVTVLVYYFGIRFFTLYEDFNIYL